MRRELGGERERGVLVGASVLPHGRRGVGANIPEPRQRNRTAEVPTRRSDCFPYAPPQSVMSNLLKNEYPFLQKELFLNLDDDGACTRGEGCMCDQTLANGTSLTVPCNAATNASTACMYGAICYIVTLALSAVCCVMGKTKKTTGVGSL